MPSRLTPRAVLGALLLFALGATPAFAISFTPTQFVAENAVPGVTFNTPTSFVFVPGGRMFVAEKRGQVHIVNANGTRVATPLWSRESEVLNNGDRGLLGIALDPNYVTNKLVYLLYTVDPDSNGNDNNDDAYSRLVRYRVSAADSNVLDASTRTVLIGTNWATGIPTASPSHTIGELQFGRDGSLLISTGDGAQFNSMDQGGQDAGQFSSGRTDPFEDIGAFRAQYIGSLAGKILRIDPATGLGYPSNPYYQPATPRSNQSLVWCYGLRNPFRFCVRPGTGVTDPTAGNPGTLYIGDVGWTTWEEQNVATAGGRNFGWPCYEGIGQNGSYQGASPSHHGCGTIGGASNPGTLTPPIIAYHHSSASQGTPPGFAGNAATGGAFYTATTYPTAYRGFFFADYGQNWIRIAQVNASNQVISVAPFAADAEGPVCMRTHPTTGDLFYVSIFANQLRRIRYTGPTDNNVPPVAAASGNPTSGPAPLTVQFSSAGSSDPNGDPITFSWNFGDGEVATGASPSHVYTSAGAYQALLTVSDNRGGVSTATVDINATGVSAGFPTTPVLDNFNRANGAVGSPWTGDVNGLTVAGNALTQTCCVVSAVWNGATFGPDQEAYITLNQITANAPEHDLMLKVQGTTYQSGHIEVRYDHVVRQLQVATYLSSSGWTKRGAAIPVTFVNGDRLGARARPNGTVEVYRNGTLLGTRDCGDWPFKALGGRIGLTLDLAFSSTMDNFGGGNVVAGNTKPTATIHAPANNAFFIGNQTVNLQGSGLDGQDAAGALQYRWEVDILHNTHVHPSSSVSTGASSSFVATNHDDGTGAHYRINFLVTDTGGLTDTARVEIWPEVDLDPSTVATTPAAPTSSDSITYAFKIRNFGRLPAPISRWRLRAGAALVAEGDVIVPALDSVAISVKRGPLTAGNQVIRLVADTLGTVPETNEGNNAKTRTLAITGPPPPPPPPPTGFPATAVLDNFNRANGPVGGSWTGDVNGFTIVSNQGAQSCCYISAVWNGTGGIFGPDQEAYVKLNAVTAGAPEHDLMLKVQGTTYAAGHIEVRYDSRIPHVQVSTHTSSTGWTNRGAAIPVSFAAGDVFGARARADGTIEVYKNGTMIGARSAGTWPYAALGGRLGVTLDGALSSRLEDFGGGNVPAATPIAQTFPGDDAGITFASKRAASGGGTLGLSTPFPSPSDGDVAMTLDLPRAERVQFTVHDLQGRLVWRDAREDYGAGSFRLQWNGRGDAGRLPAGVYLARVQVGAQSMVRRIVLVN